MGKVVLVKNNKGGVGKSWITLQLAHAMTIIKGAKVLILTSDSQNNILDYAGLSVEYGTGLENWLSKGEGELIKLRENLYFIPLTTSSLSISLKEKLKALLEDFKQEYRYIFIDSTPTLNLDKEFVECADDVVIPTFLDAVSTGSITNLLTELDASKIKAVIPNRFTRTAKEKEYFKSLTDIFEGTEIYLSIPISQSGEIGKLIDKGKTIWETGSSKLTTIQEVMAKVIEVIL